MVQRQLERLGRRRSEEDEADDLAEEEEDIGGVMVSINSLTIETEGTEEEAVEGLSASLEMEVKENRGSEGEEYVGGAQRSLGSLEFLTQNADPSGTTLVDAHNGFNKMS